MRKRDATSRVFSSAQRLVILLGPGSRPHEACLEHWLSALSGGQCRSGRESFRSWCTAANGANGANGANAATAANGANACNSANAISGAADEQLFLRQTYLSVICRLISAAALSPGTLPAGDEELLAIAGGDWFPSARIANFTPSDDLFAWPASLPSDVAVPPLRCIRDTLAEFDFSELDADALKPLHHAHISPVSRRPLGELYTPDWLAAWLIEEMIGEHVGKDFHGSLLDPSCGSGTFLFFAIRRLRALLPPTPETLVSIVDAVCGTDVNPLAIEMAKTNYLLALGGLLSERPVDFRLPIEQCDALAKSAWTPQYPLIIGNPPWLPLRAYPPERQAFMKRLATDVYGLADGRGEMVTHLETAALFLAHCADAALEPGGKIAFVLPKTLFNGEQYHRLRIGDIRLPASPGCGLVHTGAMDCEGVAPLFATPATVLQCEKRVGAHASQTASFPVTRLSGALPHRDAPLNVARRLITRQEGILSLHRAGGRSWWSTEAPAAKSSSSSPYKKRFRQGASLVPRTFWFVDSAADGNEGRVVSSPPGKGGPVAAYRDVRLSGMVEEPFLFATLLGDDLLPFGGRRFRLVVLPAEFVNDMPLMLDAISADAKGFPGLAGWLRHAEIAWAERRGEKASRMTIYQRLDHVGGLTVQRPSARFRVLYPNFQRAGVACVVDSHDSRIQSSSGFIADTALYYCETEDEAEAGYLCAVLNCAAADAALAPLRKGDQAAHPNVHKKLFDLAPIPFYSRDSPLHQRLAVLGRGCEKRVNEWLAAGDADLKGNIAGARRAIRGRLSEELSEIDAIVAELFELASRIS